MSVKLFFLFSAKCPFGVLPVRPNVFGLVSVRPNVTYLLGYMDTWSGFEAAKTAPWPSRGLDHCSKILEPSDE